MTRRTTRYGVAPRDYLRLQRQAEGMFDFTAVAVIGADDGPVRICVTKDPEERFRVTKKNCALQPKLQFPNPALKGRAAGWCWSEGPAKHIGDLILKAVAKMGLILPGKDDWVNMSAQTAVNLVQSTARRCEIELHPRTECEAAIEAAVEELVGKLVPKEAPAGLRRGAARGR